MSPVVDYVPRAEGHVSPFGKAVEDMRVSASLDDDRLFAEVRGWYDVHVVVADGYAEQVSDAEMAEKVTRLARLLFVARTREYYRLMDVHLQPDPLALRRMRDGFEKAVEDGQAVGTAAGGDLEIVSIGMRHFDVTIQPGTCTRLGSEGLGSALSLAANGMVAAWLQVLADHKEEKWSR